MRLPIKSVCCLALVSTVLFAIAISQEHPREKAIPRDTSFTLTNTVPKIYKEYPHATLVSSALPSDVALQENIVYARYGERRLHLDLFSPRDKKTGPLPGVILIHGGGWRSGNRQMEWPMAEYLAARGYVTATVEYRLSPEALYPAGVHDLKGAIRWMRANAGRYNVDPNRVAVYGCSAGGELAAFLGTTGGRKEFEGDAGNGQLSSRVQAVVDIDGILDFTNPAESGKDSDPNKPSAGRAWFGATYKEKPEIWRDASPIKYVDGTTAPILFVNSSQERYHAGRDEMISQLNRLGIYSEVRTIPDTPHPFWLFHPWFDEASGTIVKFLDKTLKDR